MKPSYDKKGIEIRAGDILKVYHFTGARNKKHYMYKMAWIYSWHSEDPVNGRVIHKRMMGNHLDRSSIAGISEKNSYALPTGILTDYEIVQGYNNQGDELDFNDRPRIKI